MLGRRTCFFSWFWFYRLCSDPVLGQDSSPLSMSLYRNGNGNSDAGEITVFLGSFVHAESGNNPFVLVNNGVIGVQHGKVIYSN